MTPKIFTFAIKDELDAETIHTFRHVPLAAIPLVREYDKLLKRLDTGTGTLDMLAMTFSEDEHEAMSSLSLSGVLLWVKALTRVVGDDGLDTLMLYYMALGQVQMGVKRPGSSEFLWVNVQTEEDCEHLPSPVLLFVCVWHVIGELLRPFVDLLPRSIARVLGAAYGSTTSPTEATGEQPAPTSESVS